MNGERLCVQGAWPPAASSWFPISLFKVYCADAARGSRRTRCPGPAQIVPKQSRNYSWIQEKKALAVPGFHLEHEIFPLVSYKPHHGEYISPNRRAGEDPTSRLAHRNLLDPGLHQSDMSLSWHLLTESIFPRSVGLLWPASMFLSYFQNDQALFLGIFSSRLLKLSRLAFQ